MRRIGIFTKIKEILGRKIRMKTDISREELRAMAFKWAKENATDFIFENFGECKFEIDANEDRVNIFIEDEKLLLHGLKVLTPMEIPSLEHYNKSSEEIEFLSDSVLGKYIRVYSLSKLNDVNRSEQREKELLARRD